jgi:hypothetical protein
MEVGAREDFVVADLIEWVVRRSIPAVGWGRHGAVQGVGGGIVIDHLDAISARSREEFLVRDFDLGTKNATAEFDARILGNDGHAASRVIGQLSPPGVEYDTSIVSLTTSAFQNS